MATRKQFQTNLKVPATLKRRLEAQRKRGVSEEDLREQRVSFAFGNAPADSKLITKASVRTASKRIRLQ
ncbi:MAG TPA: hypothetical protein VJT15_16675 [Pyrinomonadaceae bacterium]|nr:hypothetical protein [Pyrinomonadaceae bacterium]